MISTMKSLVKGTIRRVGAAASALTSAQQQQFQSPGNSCTIASMISAANITDGNGNNVNAMGFSISTDGVLQVLLAGGQTVSYPTGTFALNVQHTLNINRVLGNTTAVGFLYW